MSATHAMLRSQGGIINGVLGVGDDDTLSEVLREWALDPATEVILKVPLELARRSFLERTAPIIAEMGL